MPNLVLIGYMGTGKTTVGKKLAKRLGMKFVDTDHEIERVTGTTIKDIFDKYGEIRFRSEEKAAIRRVTRDDNLIIATGGGAVLDSENIELLQQNGLLVCLEAKPEIIHERTKRKKNRPLLRTENPLQKIIKMLAEREPFYGLASFRINTSNREIDDVVEEVGQIFVSYRDNRER
ncbi:shikimate kinase [Phosphitispora sp. TUW77]|uniref:shikimate kinase n=1 Tax=Phosphitispora sp. TUW77 TaxID=3152361 RepID=UPI003AB6A1C4